MDENVVWHQPLVTRELRARQNGHRSIVVWFTGLSGAGKSTLAHALEVRLNGDGVRTTVLDGDNVRHGLCSDLGFTLEDRRENLRRVGEVAKLFVEAGVIVLAAFISPLREDRERVRSLFPHGDFFEVYCRADLSICEGRDVKGLYARARAGKIQNFTGISSPYEEPVNPELTLDSGTASVEACVAQLITALKAEGVLWGPASG